MNKNINFLLLDERRNVVDFSPSIEEKYPGLLAKDFFKNLLAGYDDDYFSQPVALNYSFFENTANKLIMHKCAEGLVCYVIKGENYNLKNSMNIQYRLREPLSGIFSLLPLLAENMSAGEERKSQTNISDIYLYSYRLLRSVNNITLAEKILDGEKAEIKSIDFSSLLESLITSIQAVERNVSITARIEKNISISANSPLWTTAVLNLVANSIAFKRDDKVNINIKLSVLGKNAVLKYSDNSIGIKEEYQSFVFRPYFSKDPYADGEVDPSLGLGLFLLKSAVDSAGGSILLTSRFGEGVSYSISMPLDTSGGTMLDSHPGDFLLNKYSELFVQLCESCDLPLLR